MSLDVINDTYLGLETRRDDVQPRHVLRVALKLVSLSGRYVSGPAKAICILNSSWLGTFLKFAILRLRRAWNGVFQFHTRLHLLGAIWGSRCLSWSILD